MPKIDISAVPLRTGSIYPPPYDAEVAGRRSQRLGDAAELTQVGANLVHLEEVAHDPGQGIKVTMESGRARFTAEDGGPLPTP